MLYTEPLTFACMTTPRLVNLQILVPKVLPYVDKAVIVIGRNDQDVIQYLTELDPKVQVVYRPWDDNFANQWNAYLPHIEEGWILVTDDDEIPSDDMLQSMGRYINDSNFGDKHSCVKYKANPISENQDLGPCNYWREMLFRYTPRMKYYGGPRTGCHQYLTGYQNARHINSNEVYYHVKSLKDEHRNASRNYFIYGIWPHGARDGILREEWHEMKEVVSRTYPEVKTFMDLDPILIAGNIHLDLKGWLSRTYEKFKEHPEYNEMRAFYHYYFKYLHPEELTS